MHRICIFSRYGGRSTFASNPLTPPLGTSTPTHTRFGTNSGNNNNNQTTTNIMEESRYSAPGGAASTTNGMDDSQISLKEQVTDVAQSYISSSSHHPSMSGSVIEYGGSRLETLQPSKEIEGIFLILHSH
ncbi:unnamed protein product [Anisakis simplex]|uniref:Uncharacterized protein n=1 Tax=Anisakis simplex TaxID=6269 RepID=A0A0M3JDK9_ANISI|nr:unnamed protein product [Anisakis simplex]